jgi:alpha,alpha-trehalase
MDGVVTDTASAHAAAWKRLFDEYLRRRAQRSGGEFTAFDIDGDFREYVDGKPRYDGVKSFLESRGIELPFGDPGDGPDTETVCGLGNRKNRYFHAWLAENRVRTYPSTINLLRALRDAGIRTGMFASSRNGAAVLENAGIGELFDIKLDGVDLSELGMRGKPDPAMLFESAARLDAVPARTAIVEDAISGVQAGSAGGFAPVIGVNRDDYGDALIARGEATKELMASDR